MLFYKNAYDILFSLTTPQGSVYMDELKPIIIPIIDEIDEEEQEYEEWFMSDMTPEEIEEFKKPREQVEKERTEQLEKAEEKAEKLFEIYSNSIKFLLSNPTRKNEKNQFIKKHTYGDFENGIGKRLKYLREQRNFPQAVIYNNADIDRVNYSRIEKGERVPKLSTLQKILKELDVSLYEFLYPTKYEDWINVDSRMFMKDPTDIFALRDYVRNKTSGQLYYLRDGERVILSGKKKEMFLNVLYTAFDILDLMKHDN